MDFNQFVSLRLEALRERPRMWGTSNETIESLALQLLEVEIRHYQPEAHDSKPRLMMDAYVQELSRRYGSGVLPLHARTPDVYQHEPKVHNFDQELFDICQKVRASLRAEFSLEPPFEVLPIHRLEYYLRLHFPKGAFVLTAPLRPEDTWTLDATYERRWLVLTWMAPAHFSVSSTDDALYGDGPDHVFSSYEETFKRARELLSEAGA